MRRVLAEKLDDIVARLEHIPRKSLKRLAQEVEYQSLVQQGQHNCWSLDPIKQTAIHALQQHDPASWVHFYSWFLQSVVEGEIDLQLAFFSMKRGYTCRDT
jgi:hypothetical protein